MTQRILYTIALFNLTVYFAISAPPKLEIPSEIQASGDYVSFVPETDATNVAYVALSGVESFPSGMLKDQRSFVLPVRGLKDGKYGFVAIGIKDNEYTRKDFVVVVGKIIPPKPNPPIPPKPDPPKPEPKPNPKLDDAPVKTDGLHVLFIYETGQRLSAQQFAIMYGAKVRGWLDTNCDTDNKQPQYRLLDKDQSPTVEPWATSIKRTRNSIPWIVVMSGKKYVYEKPLTDMTEDDFIALMSGLKSKTLAPMPKIKTK